MQLSRRNFIKFVVGGAVGVNFTPLPWKLTDDIAIWTQNWPWVPVPAEGEVNWVSSVCQACPGACAIDVRRVGTRAVKIEGRAEAAINPGGTCPLGMGGLQLLYNASIRQTGPKRLVGPKGSGQYEAIGWDEALDMLTQRLGKLRADGQPQRLAALDGTHAGSTSGLLLERLLMVFGSPNYMRLSSLEDTYRIANHLMLGEELPAAYDLENAGHVLSFGCGLLEGWGAPGRVLNAWRLWRQGNDKDGPRIVQIESRASNTASKADAWVAARPGSEAALALGLAHVIISEKLYDERFVAAKVFGFEDWTSGDGKPHVGFRNLVLANYAPEQAARLTGVAAERIVGLAREFATAERPLAIYGKGKGDLPGSVLECLAVHSLNALVGNINRPGGLLVPERVPLEPLPQPLLDGTAATGLATPDLKHGKAGGGPFATGSAGQLAQAILDASESPVDTVLLLSGNPCFTLPEGAQLEKALAKVPFVVSFSPYTDETAALADLILPDHAGLEKMDDLVWPTGLQYPFYAVSQPVVDPLYNTRQVGDVILALAQELGSSVRDAFPWRTFEEVLKFRAHGLYKAAKGRVRLEERFAAWEAGPRGAEIVTETLTAEFASADLLWAALKDSGFWYRPRRALEQGVGPLKTPSGKLELASQALYGAVQAAGGETAALGLTVSGDAALAPHQVGAPAEAPGYPLTLVPYGIINLASGWLPSPPFVYKTIPDRLLRQKESFAEIHPETAAAYGIRQGDLMAVRSAGGEVRVRAALFEGAMPGVVFMPLGFGHTAYDEFTRDKGVNPHRIVQAGRDPLSGTPVWWQTRVQIAKV